MGFGPHTLTWLRVLTADGQASVLVNGHQSAPFPVRNGLPQGSTLSPVLWAIQLEPLTAYLQHLVRSGALHTPTLPDSTPAPPVSHHADDTTLLVSDADRDGPVAKQAVALFCRASNAKENASKSKGMVLGTHAPITDSHAATGAVFVAPDAAEPLRHLGVPLTADMAKAARACYDGRLGLLRQRAARWRQHTLSMVGRAHVAKQVLGNTLAFHLSFVPPTPPQLVAALRAVDGYVAWSPLPEDASLVARGHVLLLPKPGVACLSRPEGGIGHVDLGSFAAALMAKTLVQLAHPGRKPWQVLHRAQLAAAAPPGTQGWGWVYGTCPIPDSLPARLQALVQAYRDTSSRRRPFVPGQHDPRAVLAEPLFYNAALVDPATGAPFVPPPDVPAAFPRTLAQLRAAAAGVAALPAFQAIMAALPPDWRALLPPDPLHDPLPALPTWRVAPDGGWVVDPAGTVYTVSPAGRVVDGAGASPLPTDAWAPACVLRCRKPKSRWTLAERQAYMAAPVWDRPSLWPVEDQLLGPWEGLQCFPPVHGHGQMSLLHYEVRNARRLFTSRQAAEELGAGSVPLRPAAWPDLPQAAGPSAAHSSRLARLEENWEAQRPQSVAAQLAHFVPSPPGWMQASGSPARQSAADQRAHQWQRRNASSPQRLAVGRPGGSQTAERRTPDTAAAAMDAAGPSTSAGAGPSGSGPEQPGPAEPPAPRSAGQAQGSDGAPRGSDQA